MKFKLIFSILFIQIFIISQAVADDLPLPRFVSVKASEANVRTGPGLRYQIKWVLVRRGIPLEVVAEFEQWRKVRDIQGGEGWIHRSMLSGKRSGVIIGETQILRRSADADSYPVARAEVGSHGNILECDDNSCLMRMQGFKGWVPRQNLWGIYKNEEVD